MTMTNVPDITSQSEVAPGSLVYAPESRLWCISDEQDRLIRLESLKPANVNGHVVCYGHDYQLHVNPESAVRISYPWVEDECPRGGLATFGENGHPSIVLGRDERGQLMALGLLDGELLYYGPEVGETLLFSEWSMTIQGSLPVDELKRVHHFTAMQSADS